MAPPRSDDPIVGYHGPSSRIARMLGVIWLGGLMFVGYQATAGDGWVAVVATVWCLFPLTLYAIVKLADGDAERQAMRQIRAGRTFITWRVPADRWHRARKQHLGSVFLTRVVSSSAYLILPFFQLAVCGVEDTSTVGVMLGALSTILVITYVRDWSYGRILDGEAVFAIGEFGLYVNGRVFPSTMPANVVGQILEVGEVAVAPIPDGLNEAVKDGLRTLNATLELDADSR